MTTTATLGWGSSCLPATPAPEVDLHPADRLAVQQTLARYAFALDHADLTALEAVLTEDATWTATIAAETDLGPFIGRAAVIDVVREATRTQTEQRRHNLVNIVINGAHTDTAQAWAYLMLTSNADGKATLITTGFYTFTLQRTSNEWRIAKIFVGLDTAEQ